MLKQVENNSFIAEPCYYKDMIKIINKTKQEMIIHKKDIDKLIELLEKSKCEFREV